MNTILYRTVPLASRTAVRASKQYYKPQPCQFKAGSRRTFSARSSLLVKKYTEDHEWIELDSGGKIGTIGITTYAANQLGDVIYVELPEQDLEVIKGDTIGAVESTKTASDIMSPVSGVIKEINKHLEDKPGTISKSPEDNGWLAKIEVTDASELDALMSKEDYTAFTEKED